MLLFLTLPVEPKTEQSALQNDVFFFSRQNLAFFSWYVCFIPTSTTGEPYAISPTLCIRKEENRAATNFPALCVRYGSGDAERQEPPRVYCLSSPPRLRLIDNTLAPIGTQTIVVTTWSARLCGTLLYVIENWLQLRTSEPTTAPTEKKKHAHTYTLDPGALVTSSWWVQTWKKRKKIKISQVKT